MAAYDRHYDFGMRGYQQTTRPLMRGAPRRNDYDRGYDFGPPPFGWPRGYSNRVTARYNMDYIMDRKGGYDQRNFNMYGGDRPGRVGGEGMYRRPYITSGGTWTMRGASFGGGYDYPNYGPNYGGRYPDEL